MDLAKSGDNWKVDVASKENQTNGDDGLYSLVPGDTSSFSFGKAMVQAPGEHIIPAGTIRWINIETKFRTTSRRYFNYISTLFQCQMPTGI